MKASDLLKKYLKVVLERREKRMKWFYICTELLTVLYDNKEKQYKSIIREFKQFFVYRINYANQYSTMVSLVKNLTFFYDLIHLNNA